MTARMLALFNTHYAAPNLSALSATLLTEKMRWIMFTGGADSPIGTGIPCRD